MSSYKSVQQAITYRIGHSDIGLDLLTKFGPERVLEAIDDQASAFHGVQLEEIGSSDVSCWVSNIKAQLEASASRVAA